MQLHQPPRYEVGVGGGIAEPSATRVEMSIIWAMKRRRGKIILVEWGCVAKLWWRWIFAGPGDVGSWYI